jgi:hypothetical protein
MSLLTFSTAAAQAAEVVAEKASDTALTEAAILLGVATLVRADFPPSRSWRRAGISDRGRAGRAAWARTGWRRRIEARLCRNRHCVPAVPCRARTASAAALGPSARDLWSWPRAGRDDRADPHGPAHRDAGLQLAGGAGARSAARAVVDRAGAAKPQKLGADQLALWRKSLFDPVVPGSRDRADDHDRRRAVARARQSQCAAGVADGVLHRVGDRRARSGRAFRRQSVAADRRALWRTRTVRRRRPARRPRERGLHAQPAPVDRARGLHRGRDAGRFALSPRDRGRCRTLPSCAARAVLPRRRHGARHQCHPSKSAARRRACRRAGGGESCGADGASSACSASRGALRSGLGCCSVRAANSAFCCSRKRRRRS